MLLLRTSRGVDPGIPLLRSLGSNAHVWLPGANGTTVASLPSNNYLLSDGSTGYSTVDGVVGLDLDGMGGLGAELSPDPSFDIPGSWAAGAGISVSGGNATYASPAHGVNLDLASHSFVAGKTYVVTITVPAYTSGRVTVYINKTTGTPTGGTHIATGVGSFQTIIAATTNGTGLGLQADAVTAGACIMTLSVCSVKEYTGIHLTQATTANKPLVRRGMFNELLNSATPATQSVTCIAAPYTLALYGTGNVVLSGTGAGTLTGTGASDLVVLNFTPTAGSVTFTKAGTVSSFGLFKGTWTAAQILAEGGIPTTTATAASSPSAGKYWWSFDGSNDSLLSGNLGITNACTIVIAGRVDTIGATQVLFDEGTNGVQFYISTTGAVVLAKPGVGNVLASSAGVIAAGVPFVLTARLSGGTQVFRNLGVQFATTATAITFSATSGAKIGADAGTGGVLNGALGWVVPLPTALSDADCLTVERLVSSQFPNGPVF